MTSYRFRRRAFIAAASGGVGLKIMLRNLESSAQGPRSPARLLVTHWPVGIVAGSNDALWKPTSGSVGGSPGLKPFADAGLGPDMTVMRGLTLAPLTAAGGGGHEGATVLLVTGRSSTATRANPREPDDSVAAPGGSFDQVLLDKVPGLRRPVVGFANAIADSRTDAGELSTKVLSYATAAQTIATYGGGTTTGSIPLLPIVHPLTQYTNLFSTFVPGNPGTGGSAGTGGAGGGGAPPRVADAMLKKLVGRRSVLDFALEELNQVSRLAPAEARNKLSIHTDAVRAAEQSVVTAINTGYPGPGGAGGQAGGGGGGGDGGSACGCTTRPTSPPLGVEGVPDPAGGAGDSYSNPAGTQDDGPRHEMVGAAHLSVLRAAFVCDVIRVGTFQWSPGTNHVAFKGLYPGDPNAIYKHHPISHRINTLSTQAASTLEALDATAQFLFNAQLWYFTRHAQNLAIWKNQLDGCGNSLLDFTCVPFLTEVRAAGHERTNLPAMIIGGKQLGFIHDRYDTRSITINQLWGTIARAFGHMSTDAPFAPPVDGFLTT